MPPTPLRTAPADEPWSAPATTVTAPDTGPGTGSSTGPDTRLGVLVLHGFTGAPSSVRPWAEHLHREGFAVSVPLLPGHATTWRDLNGRTYPEWYAEAERAFEKLQTEADQVFVAGLSMGGLLGFDLALEKGREVAGLALVNPVVRSARKDLRLLPVLKHLVPAVPAIGNDVKKAGATETAYSKTPLKALHSLMQNAARVRERLPEITQPLLLLRSRTDHVVDPSSGRTIMATVSSRDLEERVLEDSYHVATLDNDAGTVFSESAAFFRRVAVSAAAGGPDESAGPA